MPDPLFEQLTKRVFTAFPRFEPSPARTALLTIDVQFFDAHKDFGVGRKAQREGNFDLLRTYYEDVAAALPKIQSLQDCARETGIELIHVGAGPLTADTREMGAGVRSRLEGSRVDLQEFDFLPETAPQGDEIVLRKITSSTFTSTCLELILRNMGIDTVITCGFVTNGCVESTIRDARDLGFRVIHVSDASATWTRDLQESSCRYMAMSHGNVRTTADIVGAMREAARASSVKATKEELSGSPA